MAGGFAYVHGTTPVHRVDARVKIVALAAFSIGIFFVSAWWAMALLAAFVLAVLLVARVPLGQVSKLLIPVYVLAAFSFACNVLAAPGWEGVAAGAFFAVRMIVLVAASFAVCLTTTSTDLLDAFAKLIGPLRAVRVPVDDIAMTLALSLRFIPVIESEFLRIRAAQRARGAESEASFTRALKVWGSAFAALFVGLFRHADSLALAMDARCYGAVTKRTRLPRQSDHRR